MAVTIKQIAELAGVSIGTVDRALNNRGRIKPEVKQRILEIAKALNYAPNVVAKSLSIRNRNLKIGFIFHVQQNEYHDAVIAGIKQAAEEIHDFGIKVLIRETLDFNVEDQLRLIDELIAENISALAIIPIDDYRITSRLDELCKLGIPVVFVGGYIEDVSCLCQISHDSDLQGRLAANLFDLMTDGPIKILVFSPTLNIVSHVKVISGLRSCFEKYYPRIQIADVVELENDEISNYNTVKLTLSKFKNVDAIFFSTAVISGGLRAIQEVCGSQKIPVVTTFYSETVRNAMINDQVCASVWYNPKEVGYRSIMVLFEYIVSEQVPDNKVINAKTSILLKQNVI